MINMPRTAKPRRMSMERMRSDGAVGEILIMS